MKPVVTEVINFCHELDLLEAHLDEHQHFMDRIVVVESGRTYSGMAKPLYFEHNKKRFSRFNIEHEILPMDLHVGIPSKYDESEHKQWFDERRNNRERQQRYIFDKYKVDADYICNTDVDEIWSRDAFFRVEELMKKEYCYIEPGLKAFQGYVDNQFQTSNHCRITKSSMDTHVKQKGTLRGGTLRVGWHFSSVYKNPVDMWMKGAGMAQSLGYLGWETVPSPAECEELMKSGKYPHTGTDVKIKHVMPVDDLSWLPPFMRENKDLWPWLTEEAREGFPVVDDWHMP